MSKQFILIGHPVGHSVSPSIHHAAYAQLGIDAHYGLSDCPDSEAVRVQVERIRRGEVSGANVTVPHKELAFSHADVIDPTAQQVGVANVLAMNASGQLVAYNTDASALGSELKRCQQESGVDVAARPAALVIGNGGAARAAVVACRLAGITRVGVTARKFSDATQRASWPRGDEFVELGAELLCWPAQHPAEVASFVEQAHMIVQATSAGMKGAPGGDELASALPWDSFARGVAYDLVYNPPVTPFLAQAKARGHLTEGGLGMLVGQAADAIAIWLGHQPDRVPLLAAARGALGL